jgi:hypothetical protein
MADPTQPTEGAGTALEAREDEPQQIVRPASAAIMTAEQFDSTWRMSRALAKSGSFKDIGADQGEKALARILLGADLGMSPTQALMGIDIVKGSPQIRGVALGRMVRNSAKRPTPTGESYDYAVLDRGFTPGEEYAVVALYRRDEDGQWPWVEGDPVSFPTVIGDVTISTGERLPEAVEAFVLDQAKKRGLVKTDGAWMTEPEVMVVWRALSQLVRFYAPDVIGGMPVYTEADGLREPGIAAGQGSGEPVGWSGLSVEQAALAEGLLKRAETLGHAGLSRRAVMEQRLNGQASPDIDRLIAAATAELDALEAQMKAKAEPIEDADVVPDAEPESDHDRAARLEREALDLLSSADGVEEEDPERAEELRAEAAAKHDLAVAAGDPDQTTLPEM